MSHQWSTSRQCLVENLFLNAAASAGITVTAGGAGKGSYTTEVNTSFAYEHIVLCIGKSSTAADYLIDIAVGSGTTPYVIALNLRHDSLKAAGNTVTYYELPLHIPAGAAVRLRAQASSASATIAVSLMGFSSGYRGMPGFSRMIPLYTPSSSRGAAVDPGGVANTRTRVQLIASTPVDIHGVLFSIGHNTDVARAAQARFVFDLEAGASGSEYSIISGLILVWNTNADGPSLRSYPPIPCFIPAGTRLSINAECNISTAGDRAIDFSYWGFVI